MGEQLAVIYGKLAHVICTQLPSVLMTSETLPPPYFLDSSPEKRMGKAMWKCI